MSLRRVVTFVLLLAAALGSGGCGSDPTEPPPDPDSGSQTLTESARVLPESEESALLAYDGETGVFEFDAGSDYAAELEVGSVLLGKNDAHAPHGFLRTVTGLSTTDGRRIAATSQARLTDAFETLLVDESIPLRPSQIRSEALKDGVVLLPDKDDLAFSLALDVVAYDLDGDPGTTGDQIRIEGRYDFSAELQAFIEITPTGGLERLEFALASEQEASLDLVAGATWDFVDREFELAELRLARIAVAQAVWITPTLRLVAHLDGNLTVSLRTGVACTQEIRSGLAYASTASPRFSAIAEPGPVEYSATPPTLTTELAIGTGASLDLACLIYDLVGPYVGGRTTLDFEAALADCGVETELELDAKHGVRVGLDLEALAEGLDWSHDFELYSQRVGEWRFSLVGTGTVTVAPGPDGLDAPWSLAGPCGYSTSGSGAATIQDRTPGEYTLTWGSLFGYATPSPETTTLAVGDTLAFSGFYADGQGPTDGFVTVAAGTFTMGSPASERGHRADESQRSVTLTTPFAMQPTEVTNAQFAEMAQWALDNGFCTVVGGTSLIDALDGSTEDLFILNSQNAEVSYSDGTLTVHAGKEAHPAKHVTWYGAAAYCDWLSLRTGLPRAYDHATWRCNDNDPYRALGYRLPTEAEWEYACRAGSTAAFANGPIAEAWEECDDPVLDAIAWYCGNLEDGFSTRAVGGRIANGWGLKDLHGNVQEWCNDWYAADLAGGVDPVGPDADTSVRVSRGGRWNSYAAQCRSARRTGSNPANASYDGSGFRPVISVSAPVPSSAPPSPRR
jgi:formylglycine-generating enzyme required for sulfatase activity